MHCPNCGKLLTAVSQDFVSENKYYVCLPCSWSLSLTARDEEFNGKNGNGVTVSDFIRCLNILDARHDEGLATRRLVRKLLLLCLLNREKGRFHINLTEPLASAASRIREASSTSECDDMRVLLTGLSLLYLGGALNDRSSAGKPEAPVEQAIPVHPQSTRISTQSLQANLRDGAAPSRGSSKTRGPRKHRPSRKRRKPAVGSLPLPSAIRSCLRTLLPSGRWNPSVGYVSTILSMLPYGSSTTEFSPECPASTCPASAQTERSS